MLRFFDKYFVFFAAGTIFSLTVPAGLQAADGKLYILNYEDAAVSPRAKVVDMTERLRRLVRQSIPGGKKQKTREIFAVFPDGKRFSRSPSSSTSRMICGSSCRRRTRR